MVEPLGCPATLIANNIEEGVSARFLLNLACAAAQPPAVVAGFEEVGGTGSEKSASEELPVGDNPGVTACAPAAASTFANQRRGVRHAAEADSRRI